MSRMITVRLSDDRTARLDALVTGGAYSSRASALTAAVDELLAEAESRAIDRAIVEGYERIPPTADEAAYARASGIRSVSAEPW